MANGDTGNQIGRPLTMDKWITPDSAPPPPPEQQITQFPYLQRAVVIVNGMLYWEWESVQVRHAIGERPFFSGRFTCSEVEPAYPQRWAMLRIRPGDEVTIYLDGYLALSGIVATRQVFFDAHTHSVEIQVAGKDSMMGHAAAVHKTGEFKNKPPEDIIKEVTKPFGINVQQIGAAAGQKLDRFSIRPGERAGEVVERLARMGGMWMTSNVQGDLVLMTTSIGGVGAFVEGVNILEGREVIHSLSASSNQTAAQQGPGNDQKWGADPTHQRFTNESGPSDFSPGYMPRAFMNEIPGFAKDLLKTRARIENNADDHNQIWVTVKVLGWQPAGGGGLYLRGAEYWVESPMLIMDRTLTAKVVTFNQDNSTGTTTTLELVNRLSGYSPANPGAESGVHT